MVSQIVFVSRNQDGFLKIQNENGIYIAYIQGGPIKIKINNDSIEMAADDWTGGSMPFERYFRGTMIKGEMSGVFGPENDITEEQKLLCQKIPLGCPFPEGSWTAKRLEKESVTDVLSERLIGRQLVWDSEDKIWEIKSWQLRILNGDGNEEITSGLQLDTALLINPSDFDNNYKLNETLTLTELNKYIEGKRPFNHGTRPLIDGVYVGEHKNNIDYHGEGIFYFFENIFDHQTI